MKPLVDRLLPHGGFAMSATTAWRYVQEATQLLADRAPTLRTALRRARAEGHAYLIIDGTLIPIDHVLHERGRQAAD